MGHNAPPFVSLGDVVQRGANVLVQCSFHCDHRTVVDAERLWRWFKVHGWDTKLTMISKHLRCSKCLAHAERIRPVFHPPTGPQWGPRTEEEWNRVVKRMRNY